MFPSKAVELLQAQSQHLIETVHQLQARIHELEEQRAQATSSNILLSSTMQSLSSAFSTEALLQSIKQTHAGPTSQIVQQINALLQHGHQILHGPDTPDHFPAVSMDVVTSQH